ncbi:dihydrodipicolinate synthase family protein [Larkinella bovis]|uniref:Dihydrodipicolinate synthase family protein n=1 Tax=Larkinella bovis TaxID=683041 RepID=A0ABW0IFX6_9BACT
MERFEGLIAAHFSPFDEKGLVNKSIIKPYVDHLVDNGVVGVFVNGSNGEGPNLTINERMEVAELFQEAAGDRIKTIIHVGHSSIAEARTLAVHAQEIGADAIASVAAFYFKPTSVSMLTDCMAEIASATPELPFFYYHIPSLTGVGMDMIQFLELGRERIPNLQGIKYTAPTLWEYQSCLEYAGDDFDVLYGTDEMLLSALVVGAKGAIGSTFNFAAPLYQKVIQDFRLGNLEEARMLQARLVEMVRILLAFPAIPAQKAVMKMLGFDLGPCRLPLAHSLSESDYTTLKNRLEAIHFFEELKAVAVL